MLRVVSLDLGFHVVIGVGRLNVQQEGLYVNRISPRNRIYQVQNSFLLDVVIRLCPVIVHSICIPNSCIFSIANNGSLEVLSLHSPKHQHLLGFDPRIGEQRNCAHEDEWQ